jgi:hypothetical protein
VDPLVAIGVVALSYSVSMLGWRRVRVIVGRRDGIERAVFAAYDHRALALERAAEVPAVPVEATGPVVAAVAAGAATLPLGELPEPWRGAPWGRATPAALREARDHLLAGRVDEAAALAAGHPAAASLFAWASLARLFAGELAAALEVARALPAAAPDAAPVAARLAAQVLARAVEVTPPGPDRAAALREALAAARAAGGGAPDAPPALVGLAAHLRLLGISPFTLETTQLVVGRSLQRALARPPDAPYLHLCRAHLAAALGEGEAAALHLARALYYARGERFYARAVRGSGWLARHRPALFAGAADALEPAVVDAHAPAGAEAPAAANRPPGPRAD